MKKNNQNVTRLTLHIDPGLNPGEDDLDLLTRQLRSELNQMSVESVDLIQEGRVPLGAKSAEAITAGALAIAVLPPFIPQLVTFLQSWVMRAENRRVTIKSQIGDRSIELEYAPKSMSQDELVNLVNTLTNALKSEEKESPSEKEV